MIDHEIDELRSFRAQFVIHLLSFRYHEIIVSDGMSVSVGEYFLFVDRIDLIITQTLSLSFVQFLTERHQNGPHLLSERSHFFLSVIGPSLVHISYGNIVLVAQVPSHLVSDLDEFIPDLFKSLFVTVIEIRVSLESGPSHLSVIVLKEFLEAVEVSLLSHEFHLALSHDGLILICELCLLLHQRDIGFAEGLLLKFHLHEVLFTQFLLYV